jgi:hypothetical protein
MSDKKHQKRPHPKKKQAPQLSPEEKAVLLAAMQKAAEEREAERQRIELYGKAVGKMSHRQLRGELVRAVKREYAGKPPQPQAGMNICLASIFLTVLDNTRTEAKGLRPDQINPFGKLAAYPR